MMSELSQRKGSKIWRGIAVPFSLRTFVPLILCPFVLKTANIQVMRTIISILFVALFGVLPFTQTDRVTIRVDAAKGKGPMKPIWSFFGYDEPNYTYMKDGKKLLSEMAALSPVPVYVRAHSLLVTGDGTPALKWGSTNAYTEDANGKPIYDWKIVDRIFDTRQGLELPAQGLREVGRTGAPVGTAFGGAVREG